ncbi:type II secretion system minor pseudopilin GspI [Azomonas macrocytogenes]|uniref:Type II secretion system protein I n=1 Tax=Azomonas macrocytogenes TaxID=69962 RepID=A0A839T1G9_AZOMA|nr:type II secretion system minor pseudopilin GspI [Azomonas macrocytogenes]MBB3103242.1 general secretion pathway protein I [Azomonas macrocytogenes]
MTRRSGGFTLLEVMVALAIFAIVAAAVLTATSRALTNSARLTDLTLAGWVADNRLTELQLAKPVPGTGREKHELDYADRRWATESLIEATSDPSLLRATVWVAIPSRSRSSPSAHALTSLTGFLEVTEQDQEQQEQQEQEAPDAATAH